MANEEPRYLAWVRSLPCSVGSSCFGRIEAHHSPFRKGTGQKNHDETCVPVCLKHHREFHDAWGHFRGWSRDQRKDWQDKLARELRARYRPKPVPLDTAVNPDLEEIF